MTTTRFPNGVTNVGEDSMLADIGQLDPTKYISYMEDFFYYTAANWNETIPSGAQIIPSGEAGGLLTLNNNGFPQSLVTQSASTMLGPTNYGQANKKIWGEARFKAEYAFSAVTDGLIEIGFSGYYPKMFFRKANGSSAFSFVVGNFNGEEVTPIPSAVIEPNTFIRLGFVVDETPSVGLFVNGLFAGYASLSNKYPGAGSSYGPLARIDTVAANNNLTVDYFFFARER